MKDTITETRIEAAIADLTHGAAAATEARRKGVDIVLGPTINLHRSTRGGRHFEAFSEDPVLTSALAAAYVTGAAGQRGRSDSKHYVANDSETERFMVDVWVHERSLRELYPARVRARCRRGTRAARHELLQRGQRHDDDGE